MLPGELCSVCMLATATRMLGTTAYCEECCEAVLKPIRERVQARHGESRKLTPSVINPGLWLLECLVCGATWAGDPGEACQWCVARAERIKAEGRNLAQMVMRNLMSDHEAQMRLREQWQ